MRRFGSGSCGHARFIGWIIAAVPLGFAFLRAATTGTDFRYLWVAIASTVSAGIVVMMSRRREEQPGGRFARVAIAVFAATAVSAAAAFAQGAGSVPAVLVVSFAFALCSGIGLSLAARPHAGQP